MEVIRRKAAHVSCVLSVMTHAGWKEGADEMWRDRKEAGAFKLEAFLIYPPDLDGRSRVRTGPTADYL